MHLKRIDTFNLGLLYKPHRKTGINRPRIEPETLEGIKGTWIEGPLKAVMHLKYAKVKHYFGWVKKGVGGGDERLLECVLYIIFIRNGGWELWDTPYGTTST